MILSSHYSAVAVALFTSVLALSTRAGDLALNVVDKEPPKELDQSFRELLQPKAIQLLDGSKPVFEFWFVSNVPLKSKHESIGQHLRSLTPVTVLGALVATRSERDYRDDQLYEGLYTIRFSLQPEDGNHLGTADYPFFAVLIPAQLDPKIDGIKTYKQMVRASSKETSSEHPITLSLRPAASADGDLPKINEPAPEHLSLRVKLNGKVAGSGEETPIIFEIVYKGKTPHV